MAFILERNDDGIILTSQHQDIIYRMMFTMNITMSS